jgi:hypothetical protein
MVQIEGHDSETAIGRRDSSKTQEMRRIRFSQWVKNNSNSSCFQDVILGPFHLHLSRRTERHALPEEGCRTPGFFAV